MSNVPTQKVYIQIESASEQQEHLKNQRKTLKVLQDGAKDKENLAGRPELDKLARVKAVAANDVAILTAECPKRKKIDSRSVECQTSPEKADKQPIATSSSAVTVADLTSDTAPSAAYWERLAYQRAQALESALAENECLHQRIENYRKAIKGLEKEIEMQRSIQEESANLVSVLSDMLRARSESSSSDEELAESEGTDASDGANAPQEFSDASNDEATESTGNANDEAEIATTEHDAPDAKNVSLKEKL